MYNIIIYNNDNNNNNNNNSNTHIRLVGRSYTSAECRARQVERLEDNSSS